MKRYEIICRDKDGGIYSIFFNASNSTIALRHAVELKHDVISIVRCRRV